MGTRGIIAIKHKGEYKVAQYCQFDMYITGHGVKILNFLKKEFKKKSFIANLKKCKFIDDAVFDRTFSSDILNFIQNNKNDIILLRNAIDFVYDSLLCEYGYVIDLDTKTFEIYISNAGELSPNDRFYNGNVCVDTASSTKHYPIKLLKAYSLKGLPKEKTFIKECNKLLNV